MERLQAVTLGDDWKTRWICGGRGNAASVCGVSREASNVVNQFLVQYKTKRGDGVEMWVLHRSQSLRHGRFMVITAAGRGVTNASRRWPRYVKVRSCSRVTTLVPSVLGDGGGAQGHAPERRRGYEDQAQKLMRRRLSE